MSIIRLEDVGKTYGGSGVLVTALTNIQLAIEAGEFIAIMGPSGSGKSTLMNIIGCLDRPTAGTYYLDGRSVGELSETELARVRSQQIGFVFQTFNLFPRMSALRNVERPMVYARVPGPERSHRAEKALERVGLSDRARHLPNELSGGQRQRVAIARALVMRPKIILADEPTGNLDSASGADVMGLLRELNQDGRTVLLVTHDPEIAGYAGRIVVVRDGCIVDDQQVTSNSSYWHPTPVAGRKGDNPCGGCGRRGS